MKVVALAGGVGGAKLAYGLYHQLPAGDLTVIVNTADDFEHLGLHISPDLDTLCYTLADLANSETGWGRSNESWHAFQEIKVLGGPDWFRLGDRDLATHLERTRRMQAGQSLAQITQDFCNAWGVSAKVLPMSDDPVATIVDTEQGEMPFQEYFVARACEPKVIGFRFEGAELSSPSPGTLEAIAAADLLIICPSNPWVSIAPILAVSGIEAALLKKKVIAISPIIAGQAVKGPAAKMYSELGFEPSSKAVAHHYRKLLAAIVIDNLDRDQKEAIESMGIMAFAVDTLMKTNEDRRNLAGEVIEFGKHFLHSPTDS